MKQELIGKKVKGFSFTHKRHDNLWYSSDMDDLIGKVGVIFLYNYLTNSYEVKFDDTQRAYPAELIEQHLLEYNPLDSLPMLGEGLLCEVWNSNQSIKKTEYVCAKTPYGYVSRVEKININDIDWHPLNNWKNARAIEPVKQYTKEQLEKMVGHKFELI
jgi:hypothetical protein